VTVPAVKRDVRSPCDKRLHLKERVGTKSKVMRVMNILAAQPTLHKATHSILDCSRHALTSGHTSGKQAPGNMFLVDCGLGHQYLVSYGRATHRAQCTALSSLEASHQHLRSDDFTYSSKGALNRR
jgi:hypothetical protein